MAKLITLKLDGPRMVVDAVPLTRQEFAPFGDVIDNPRPQLHPSSAAAQAESTSPLLLPYDGIVANQGTAIKYQHVTRMVNLYDQAPSGRPGVAVANMFVCAARTLARTHPGSSDGVFPVTVLERHPYTNQTFIPLTADPHKRYLIIVAPTLPPSPADQSFPVPTEPLTGGGGGGSGGPPLPGRGLPDISRLRAFVVTSEQAVTYGAGTWHSPMVALGRPGTAVDFIVIQFANNVVIEDCQEVLLGSPPSRIDDGGLPREKGVLVRLSSIEKARLCTCGCIIGVGEVSLT